jgi:restriction system protein
MAIPDYESLMLPLLEIALDGEEHSIREVVGGLALRFHLSEAELKELLPSGANRIFDNRVRWAQTYLKKAGFIDSKKRGFFHITKRGRDVMNSRPGKINVTLLRKYPEFDKFWSPKSSNGTEQSRATANQPIAQSPEDSIASGYLQMRDQVESELLAQVKANSPEFFERLVVRVLTAMGYGGSLADAGRAIGKSGDGGIDGVIKEDKLGLDRIYIQAKRWESNVGRPEIQAFVGALHGNKAKRGIFITTSDFAKTATEYAENIEDRVVLINGAQLAELMFEYGIGVATVNSYLVKRVDSDFFSEDDGAA